MAKKAIVNYDVDQDILWVHSGDKIKDSLDLDRFVIDFSADDKIVGVEISGASKFLSEIIGSNISKLVLRGVKDASISFYQGKQILSVFLYLRIAGETERIPISSFPKRMAIPAKRK